MNAALSSAQAIKEARYAELLDERSVTQQLLQRAFDQKRYWIGRSAIETEYWQWRVRDLTYALAEVNGRMRVVLAPEELERYVGERESARRDDAETVVQSSGAVQWESS